MHWIKFCVLWALLGAMGCGDNSDTDPVTNEQSDATDPSSDDESSDPSSDASDPSSSNTGDDSERCTQIQGSIAAAGFSDSVAVRCDNEFAYLGADTYPAHDLMNGIVGTNEQVPAPAPDFEGPIRLNPAMASSVTTRDSALGIAVNGVPIYDYTAGGEIQMDSEGNSDYSSNQDTTLLGQLDNCGGHAGKGDDYHYHKSPDCMIDMMPNKNDNPIIGWAYDGYPIYGNDNPDGSSVSGSDLDPCNGQSDDTYGHRYHTSDSQPYILKCLKGEVNEQDLPRVGTSRMGGAPIDATELSYTATANSSGTETRRLSYTFQSVDYYIQYSTRTDSTRCFDVESKMCNASNGPGGGSCNELVQDDCYCREMPAGTSAPSGCQTRGGGPPN
jgi:hypothetical protein